MNGLNYQMLNLLIEHDCSQRELARTLGVSKDTVNGWINGKRNIPEYRIVEICELFGLTDPCVIVSIFLPGISTNKTEED